MFTRACHLSISWGRLTHSLLSQPIYSKPIFVLPFHLCFSLFPSVFLTKTLYAYFFSPVCAICPAYLILLCNLHNLILPGFFISEPVPDYVKAIVDTAALIHEHEPLGDILAFLTGQEEVDRAVSLLKEQAISNKSNCKLFQCQLLF